MQEKLFALTLTFSVICCLGCQNSSKTNTILNDFPQKEFEKVVAYKMNGEYGEIVENGKLAKYLVTSEKTLSEKEANTLMAILSDDTTYGDVAARCFEPHLGYVFYNDNNEMIAHATICLICNQIRTSPDIGVFILGEKGKSRLHKLEENTF